MNGRELHPSLWRCSCGAAMVLPEGAGPRTRKQCPHCDRACKCNNCAERPDTLTVAVVEFANFCAARTELSDLFEGES